MVNLKESRFRKDLVITSAYNVNEGNLIHLVRDSQSGQTFRFRSRQFFLCKNLDGVKTIDEICRSYRQRFGSSISEEEVASFLEELQAANLLEPHGQTQRRPLIGRPEPEFIWSFFLSRRRLKQLANISHEFCWLGPVSLWTSMPMTLMAVATLLHNRRSLNYDLDALFDLPLTQMLAMHFGTMWAIQLMALGLQALVITFFGGRVSKMGIRLECGFLPVIDIATENVEGLARRQKLWVYGTPLLVRLLITATSVLLWFMTRDAMGFLRILSLFTAISGSLQLAIYGSPLWYHDGYFFLGTYLRKPQILPQAQLLCSMILRRKTLPVALGAARAIGMAALGVISALATLVLLIFLVILFSNSVGKLVYGVVGQAGVPVTLLIVSAVFVRYLVQMFVKFSQTV